jgi:hypothetical protein
MKGPKPGGWPPARMVAATQAAATSRSLTPSAIAAMAASAPAPETAAARRMKRDFFGALHLAHVIDKPGYVAPARLEPAGEGQRQSMAEARRPVLHADRRPGEPLFGEHPHGDIGRRLGVAVAAERRGAHLLLDRHPLHGAGDEHRRAGDRNDEQMRGEVAPVIEAGEIEHVLRRRDDGGGKVAPHEAGAQRIDTPVDLSGAERIFKHLGPALAERQALPASLPASDDQVGILPLLVTRIV